jgi:hypothetical protein
MRTHLPKHLSIFILCIFTLHSFAEKDVMLSIPSASKNFVPFDSVSAILKKQGKICSCQILELQSTNHHHRNIGVFAEKTNGKSMNADLTRLSRVLEKEKKHMQSLFYDRLSVLNSVTETTNCRSLFSRLKYSNRSLMLYDILDADIRR